MKTTEKFKQTIQSYLEKKAGEDPLFMATFLKENKNIDDCITYILNEVQKSGCNGFTDEEIFSMAVHYYDEDSIEVGKETNMRVVVNHHIELTEEEKEEAKKKAIDDLAGEIKHKMRSSSTIKKEEKKDLPVQASLF
jgi:hypothetical protein